jgi:hypothetical protein
MRHIGINRIAKTDGISRTGQDRTIGQSSMRKLFIGIIDLVAKAPTRALWSRVMSPNFASIMPQVIATWCEEEAHDVSFVCYTGRENLAGELPDKVDIVFISTFTEAA